jgi:hypothetical protein
MDQFGNRCGVKKRRKRYGSGRERHGQTRNRGLNGIRPAVEENRSLDGECRYIRNKTSAEKMKENFDV